MSEKNLCPMCGSDKLERVILKETVQGDMGKNLLVDRTHEKCVVCGSEGDFSGENETAIEKALSTLNEAYIDETLGFFDKNKISFAGIERAVGLPQRTLTKWKNRISSPTAAGIALLKYLRIFPWLIEVAENKFDFEISQKIFLGRACNILIGSLHYSGSDAVQNGYSATTSNFTTNVYAETLKLTQENNSLQIYFEH